MTVGPEDPSREGATKEGRIKEYPAKDPAPGETTPGEATAQDLQETFLERAYHELDEAGQVAQLLSFGAEMLRGNLDEKGRWYPAYREVRERSVACLDELVEKATRALERVGCHIYHAATAEEARTRVAELVGDARLVVKGKSNTVKELEIPEMLEASGVEVVETDLGDRIIQIMDERPGHPVGPATHITAERIARALSEYSGEEVGAAPPEIVKFGREEIRRKILAAEVGLSGANAIVAENGMIGLIEGEGNLSLVTRLPPKHVVVAGIEKVVDTWEDSLAVFRASELAINQVGTYVSFIRGPSDTRDVQAVPIQGVHGAQEVHVVLVDDYRTRALAEGFGELLYCLNCGACFLACRISNLIGVGTFGTAVARGPIGIVKSAFLKDIQTAVAAGLFACAHCRQCTTTCPASIDIQGMNARLRERAVARGLASPESEALVGHILAGENPFGKSKSDKRATTEAITLEDAPAGEP